MVMERIHGIIVTQVDELRSRGTDIAKLAENGVQIFFTQVFRHNFFHADMHPGNIFVLIDDPAEPRCEANAPRSEDTTAVTECPATTPLRPRKPRLAILLVGAHSSQFFARDEIASVARSILITFLSRYNCSLSIPPRIST